MPISAAPILFKRTVYRALLTCFVLAAVPRAYGQTNSLAATTNAPAATAPVKAIALGEVVTQAQAAATAIKDQQASLDPDQALQDVNAELPKLISKIDEQSAVDARQSPSTITLRTLQMSQSDWQAISDSLDAEQKELSARVYDLDQMLWDLSQRDATWKATLAAAQAAKAPGAILDQINNARSQIAAAIKNVQNHEAALYEAQNRVAAQAARVKSALDLINKELGTARLQLFEQNGPPLWSSETFAHPASGVMVQEKASLKAQAVQLESYLKARIAAVVVHLLILGLLAFGFVWVRGAISARAEKEPALRDAVHIFNVPFANALLIALFAGAWLYPDQPRLLLAALWAAALIPTVIVTRRLIDPASFPILYAAVVAFLVDQVRYIVSPAGIVSRFLFIFELLAGSNFLLIALGFKHLSASAPDQTRLKRLTRLFLHVAFFVLVSAGLANVFGYIKLSFLLGDGMLESSYLAVVLYAAVRIVDALALSALSIRPFSGLGMVRRHHDQIYAKTTVVIRWVFYAIWVVATLQFFQQSDLLWDEINVLLWQHHYSYFNIKFTLGAILAFPITIWASFVISRFLRFVLQEEVYPHMALARGIPYATSTMIHYAILLFGFFAAVAATGTNLSQFAFLAGAFGVGLGFGMQNIMNNFVSGVILLFERPIKVGDTVQIDTNIGTVERIGIRASVILLPNGSELIVPNGNLISNPVTNWTLSNCERLIEIPVNVASKVDPRHMIDLLTKVALSHPSVLKNPAPKVLLTSLAATGLNFRVQAWIDSSDKWMEITSDLSLAINAALAKENIALS